MREQKMYVLVRKDLSNQYAAVQAGHALAEYLIKNPDTQWTNGTLIYLGVKDENELIKWIHKLDRNNITNTYFREPDIGNQITSLACVNDGKIFSKLRLK